MYCVITSAAIPAMTALVDATAGMIRFTTPAAQEELCGIWSKLLLAFEMQGTLYKLQTVLHNIRTRQLKVLNTSRRKITRSYTDSLRCYEFNL